MSDSAGRVVAWQYRVPILDHKSRWIECNAEQFILATADPDFETRALVPEQLYLDLIGTVLALADELEADNYGTIRNLDAYAQKIRALTETPSEETI